MRTIPELVTRLVEMNGGNAALAAQQLGSSAASLSRYRAGARPRKSVEARLHSLVESGGDLVEQATRTKETNRLLQLEQAIAGTLNALREEFHRTATISKRQDVLDLVAALVFAHVTSIDGPGLGTHLAQSKPASDGLNTFVADALTRYLPDSNGHGPDRSRFFVQLTVADERFAQAILTIFERDAAAFRELHEAGRDDLINEVFSRFMSTSFVDEKEMGQYLTPPEVARFMVQIGYHALTPDARAHLLEAGAGKKAGIILDPSCGVGSFLAESIRYFHEKARAQNERQASGWLTQFVAHNVVGIDKSERMLRLACVNLGLFGTRVASLYLANGLAREGDDATITTALECRAQLILTNPPFGATYGGADISAFAMAQEKARVDSEILFLERYVDWIAPGGVIVSVVPDSILVNRGLFAQLRAWLRSRCDIEAVFSLPPVTFAAAGTSTKTSVIVLRRKGRVEHSGKTYFGEAREVGYEVVTRSGQRRRIHHSRTDLPALLAEYALEKPCRIGRWEHLPSDAERWDAGFHAEATVGKNKGLLVSDIASLVDDREDPRRRKATFDYIEISDVDGRTGLVGHKRIVAGDAPSRARKRVRVGDVLISTVRPERGSIGVVPPHLDGAICSTGFAVLRCQQDVQPTVLAWLLKSAAVRRQMVRHNTGIAYPAIAEETCLSLVLPVSRSGLADVSSAARALDTAQATFEAMRQKMAKLLNRL